MAAEFHLNPIIFELDCLKLAQAAKAGEIDNSDFRNIVEDVKLCLATLPSSFFVHVYKSANSAAHKVAKFALGAGFFGRWYGPIPDGIYGFLANICNL